MKKLEVIKAFPVGTKFNVVWHRFNTEDGNNDSSGIWILNRELAGDELIAFAKGMCDPDIEVSLNLEQ